jgi:hypothetical protein
VRLEALYAILVVGACCGSVAAESGTGKLLPIAPGDGATIDTPLSATIEWSTYQGASSYEVTLRLVGTRKPVLEARGLSEPLCRVAVRPGSAYEWRAGAADSTGRIVARSEAQRFRTPEPAVKEITDYRILFAGIHPGTHWQAMEEIPADPEAQIAPWFHKKRFEDAPPPTMSQVKDRLPAPVWEGHDDLIKMYWYAWDTLFSVWLFAPKSADNMAVSNLIGLPSWGPWGSTMVWDTAFILQFARYGHFAYPFVTGLDNCYARQHENGFICRESEQ